MLARTSSQRYKTYKCRSRGSTIVQEQSSKVQERRAFIFLVIFLAPALAIMVVGGYGFMVWMSQLLLGPPGG
ncbi:MAG: periplasmic nitrate reductase, NapE protein [Halieaceae bacterium]